MNTQVDAVTLDVLYAAGYRLLSDSRTLEAAEAFRALVTIVPRDERGWLGLSECHRLRGEQMIALELLEAARIVSDSKVRCAIAESRILRQLGREGDAEHLIDCAMHSAMGEPILEALVFEERYAS